MWRRCAISEGMPLSQLLIFGAAVVVEVLATVLRGEAPQARPELSGTASQPPPRPLSSFLTGYWVGTARLARNSRVRALTDRFS
jgi:hypothetical protein